MVGNKKNRDKLVAALRKVGIKCRTYLRGYIEIYRKGDRTDRVCLENGRRHPTFIEYSVSGYATSFEGNDADAMAAEINRISRGSHQKELRECHELFEAFGDHMRGPMQDDGFIKKMRDRIDEIVESLRDTDVWYKMNDILDYNYSLHEYDFEPVQHYTKKNNVTKGTFGK
jgi:hypothetical protein